MRTVFALLVFAACQDPARAPRQDGPSDDDGQFTERAAVSIRSPADGAAVEAPFTLRFSADEAVWEVQARVDGAAASRRVRASEGQLSVEAEPGRHTVQLQAYDRAGEPLGEDSVDLRVLSPDAEGWVSFFTPSPGAEATSPVAVLVQAADTVGSVELFADGRSLGEWPVEELAWVDLDGAVTLRAEALDEHGNPLASDEVELTVTRAAGPDPSAFNERLLELIDTYPTDGTYAYYWPSGTSWSGSTRDIVYQDTLVADDGGYSACYCSGITWELYLRAWRAQDLDQGGDGEDLNGLSASALMALRRDWYVRELDGPGPSVALEGGGLGVPVPSVDDWEPGDLVQFWRTSGSGHTVVFLGWVTNTLGEREGFEYVSCQGASDGFGSNIERFGTHEGAVDPLLLYAGRALDPADWF